MIKKYFSFIVVFAVVLVIGNEIYTQVNKKPKSAKSTRLSCHKDSVTFEKVIKPKLVQELLQTLKSQDYKVNVWADKSKYMTSVMFNFVDIKKIDEDIKTKIKNYKLDIEAKKTSDVLIDVMVYENDKKDPGKKTKRSKLYAGYLVFTFKVGIKKVYKIQTDFMDLKGEDIPKRVSCIINSVMTLGEQNGTK